MSVSNDCFEVIETLFDERVRTKIARFARAHELTAAEERILAHLVVGKDIGTIIGEAKRSRATIKSHVLNIFSKTYTRRQAQLVSVFFLSPV